MEEHASITVALLMLFRIPGILRSFIRMVPHMFIDLTIVPRIFIEIPSATHVFIRIPVVAHMFIRIRYTSHLIGTTCGHGMFASLYALFVNSVKLRSG